MLLPTDHARRSLSYLMKNMLKEALDDAFQAQILISTWHVNSYLQAAALFATERENEAQIVLDS